MIFGYFILLISVMISAIAAWYSVVGLTAIFAAAVVPVMIMGGALEAGKIVATVWLHNNWRRVGIAFKLYLIPAIIFLMLLTSMGIYGFLAKAHGDQSLVSGDAMARVAIFDEKIKISKDNIDANRRALKQLDEAVDQVMGRSTDEKGADKAVQIRRSQQKERVRLQSEIQAEQKTITAISAEAAPLRAEFRKIEAEVGPIKYIAALIYGDAASQNMLEAAVRWVIILIVVVFDPLALTLILAANKQLEWARQGKGGWIHDEEDRPVEEKPAVVTPAVEDAEPTVEKVTAEATPTEPVVEEPAHCPKCNTQIIDAPGVGPCCPNKECDVFDNILGALEEQRRAQEQKELEEFFMRGQLIARGLDADQDARTVEEANAKLAEIESEDPDLDTIAAQAQEIKAVEKERDDLIEALIGITAERDSVQRELDQAHAARASIAEELEQTVTGLYASESMLTVSEEETDILRGRVTELETQATQQQEWITQLEQDLREAIQLAHDKIQELNALNTVQATVDGPLEQELSPPVITRDNTVRYQDKSYNLQAFNTLFPEMAVRPDSDPVPDTQASFGTEFPKNQKKGDMFLRVDYLPSRLYKWNGVKWIETDKAQTDRYAYDQAYIKLLVEKLQRGEYDPDDLNDTERQQVADYLKSPPDA